jgi:hypothetical protein
MRFAHDPHYLNIRRAPQAQASERTENQTQIEKLLALARFKNRAIIKSGIQSTEDVRESVIKLRTTYFTESGEDRDESHSHS